MSDVPQNESGSPVVRTILMVAAVVYLVGSVIFMVQAQIRISDMEKKQAAAQAEILKKMTDSNAQMKARGGGYYSSKVNEEVHFAFYR